MTVSTSGIVPGIVRFGRAAEIRPKLAISLNAPNNAVRERDDAHHRKWAIGDVLNAVRHVPLRPQERVTFEYVLLGGVTDRPEHADEVARLVRRRRAAVQGESDCVESRARNSVRHAGARGVRTNSSEAAGRRGNSCLHRQPRGRDIFAACGQLKRTVEG